jgi:hypothetical protein
LGGIPIGNYEEVVLKLRFEGRGKLLVVVTTNASFREGQFGGEFTLQLLAGLPGQLLVQFVAEGLLHVGAFVEAHAPRQLAHLDLVTVLLLDDLDQFLIVQFQRTALGRQAPNVFLRQRQLTAPQQHDIG